MTDKTDNNQLTHVDAPYKFTSEGMRGNQNAKKDLTKKKTCRSKLKSQADTDNQARMDRLRFILDNQACQKENQPNNK